MKHLVFIFMLFSFVGCASVNMTVNSIKNGEGLSKAVPLVFPKRDLGIEQEKLRRECAAGAALAKLRVLESCEDSNCYFVSANGEVGGKSTAMSSYYNTYTKQQVYSTNTVTARKVKISVYSDQAMKSLVWEAAIDSSGESENVLSVAKSICYGGFLHFPNEVTAESEKVRAR